MLQPVAQHDPIDCRAIGAGAFLAQIPDQFCIKARAFHAERFRIDLTDQVKIDETVIDRCHNCVGTSDRGARDRIIPSRCINHDKIGVPANPCHFLIEACWSEQAEGDMPGRW